MTTGGIITAITAVWDAIFTWLIGAVTDVMPIFYSAEGLTLLGVLALVALGISVFFLIMGLIQNFLHLRG